MDKYIEKMNQLILDNTSQIVYHSDCSFSGLGWEKLQQEVKESPLVLIGEEHGIAEIPKFTAAISDILEPDSYIFESDKYVASKLAALTLTAASPLTFLENNPEALCFCNWVEEFELVNYLYKKNTNLIGIDQLYCASSPIFFEELASAAVNSSSKNYFQECALKHRANNIELEKNGIEEFSMLDENVSQLEELIFYSNKESHKVQSMITDYIESYKIYKAQRAGIGGHQERINLMKRNLLKYYSSTNPLTHKSNKYLFKFGINHLARGLSPIKWGNFYDVGNLVQNLADINDATSLHIGVVGKEGAKACSSSRNKSLDTSILYSSEAIYLKPFFIEGNGSWNLINLSPIRDAIAIDDTLVEHTELKRLIYGYDYLVVIPNTSASRVY